MPIAETERLILRAFRAGDAPALAPILADPEVMRFSLTGPLESVGTRVFIGHCLASYADDGFGRWAVIEKASESLIGFCGIGRMIVDGVDEPELGYRLGRAWWGRGLATEAAVAGRDAARSHYGLERLIAIIEPDNVASVRVAEKAGFALEKETTYKELDVGVYAWRASC